MLDSERHDDYILTNHKEYIRINYIEYKTEHIEPYGSRENTANYRKWRKFLLCTYIDIFLWEILSTGELFKRLDLGI